MEEAVVVEAATFQGDGKYIGDGGIILEAFWRAFRWKEISNCPGRYILRDRSLNQLDVEQLLHQVITTAGAIGREMAEVEAPSSPRGQSSADMAAAAAAAIALLPVEPHATRRDAVKVVRFPGGGGGLITYCKPPTASSSSAGATGGGGGGGGGGAEQSPAVFVHTLNTRSGLSRKLRGLGIDPPPEKEDDEVKVTW